MEVINVTSETSEQLLCDECSDVVVLSLLIDKNVGDDC